MYSLKIIKDHWNIFNIAYNLLYSLIFSVWIVQTPNKSNSFLYIFVINYFLIQTLSYLIRLTVTRYYKPDYYLKGNLKLIDVIKRNTTAWGKQSPVYKDETDYNLRKEFAIGIRTMWLTYVVVVLILAILSVFISEGIINTVSIKWSRALAVFLIMSAFSLILMFLEGMEFEKERFGKAKIKLLSRDYLILATVLFVISLWILIRY